MLSRIRNLMLAIPVGVVLASPAPPAVATDNPQDYFEFFPIDICLVNDSGGQICVNHTDLDGNPWFIVNANSVHDDVDLSEPGATFRVTGEYCLYCVQTFCGSFNGFIWHAEITPCVDEDTNRDGLVNVDDLIDVILHWGACPPEAFSCRCDTNGDQLVNVDDLVSVILAM